MFGPNFMWDSETQFLNNFKTQLDKVEDYIERESLKNLLLDFNQTFYNTEKPHLFKGINIPGVQLKMADGISPQKDKLRTQADSKKPYIEEHIKTMLQQGVIEEMGNKQPTDAWVSNVLLVLEKKWQASAATTVFKSRFVIDFSHTLNRFLWGDLPKMSCYQRELARYDIFSNLDCSSFYHSIPLDDGSSYFTCFYALGRFYRYLRLPQGVKSAVGLASFIMDAMFKDSNRTFPFIDDLSTGSPGTEHKNRMDHIDKDLTLTLAICSARNLLLSPKKSEFLQTKIRILGKMIAHGEQTLSLEKREKIEKLEFPKSRDQAISCAAFFAWFAESCLGMGSKLTGLRDLIKSKKKISEPTQELEDQFK
jgi:hypothetical protein